MKFSSLSLRIFFDFEFISFDYNHISLLMISMFIVNVFYSCPFNSYVSLFKVFLSKSIVGYFYSFKSVTLFSIHSLAFRFFTPTYILYSTFSLCCLFSYTPWYVFSDVFLDSMISIL